MIFVLNKPYTEWQSNSLSYPASILNQAQVMAIQIYLRHQFQTSFKATVPHHRTNPSPSQSPSRSRESTIIIHIISYKALVCSKPSCSKVFFSSGNSHGLPKHSHKCHRIEYLCRSPTILHVLQSKATTSSFMFHFSSRSYISLQQNQHYIHHCTFQG